MCIFLFTALPASNRQCRVHPDKHVIYRRGSLTDFNCGYYVDTATGTGLMGPFVSDEAAEAALRCAAQVEIVP